METAILSTTSTLTKSDIIGTIKVRLGINRMNYSVEPGLYRLGNPDVDSKVLVSANYKLTFDSLRKELVSLDLWILILDTKGVNVWCAAGKGTFGTEELIHRIALTNLKDKVNHRDLILPQLGAPGVAAYEVTKKSGFKVIYGPVLAKDIKAFLLENCQARPAMRQVPFELKDRMVLAPIELVHASKKSLWVLLGMVLAHKAKLVSYKARDYIGFIGSVIAGTVLFPALLPYLPFRAFSLKGVSLGLIWSSFLSLPSTIDRRRKIVYHLISTAIVGYLGLNFTGSTPFTSPSGVEKETRKSVPIFIVLLALGIILQLPLGRKDRRS